MKNERKILKYVAKFRQKTLDQEQTAQNICAKLNIDFDTNIAVFIHLVNQGLITPVRFHGHLGSLLIERDPIGITTNGIKNVENYWYKKIKSWMPLILSLVAIIISSVALFS